MEKFFKIYNESGKYVKGCKTDFSAMHWCHMLNHRNDGHTYHFIDTTPPGYNEDEEE